MKRETNELAWRTKLIVGLALLGGFAASLGWASWLAEAAGGSEGWGLPQWFGWFRLLFERGFGGELLIAAAVGAALLTAPFFYLFFRKG